MAFLWTHSNTRMSVLCSGPQSWMRSTTLSSLEGTKPCHWKWLYHLYTWPTVPAGFTESSQRHGLLCLYPWLTSLLSTCSFNVHLTKLIYSTFRSVAGQTVTSSAKSGRVGPVSPYQQDAFWLSEVKGGNSRVLTFLPRNCLLFVHNMQASTATLQSELTKSLGA